eukprot:g3292.t1
MARCDVEGISRDDGVIAGGVVPAACAFGTGCGGGMVVWRAKSVRTNRSGVVLDVRLITGDDSITTKDVVTLLPSQARMRGRVGRNSTPRLTQLLHAVMLPPTFTNNTITGCPADGGISLAFVGTSIDGMLCLHRQHWCDFGNNDADPGLCLERLAEEVGERAGELLVLVNRGDESAMADVAQLVSTGLLDHTLSKNNIERTRSSSSSSIGYRTRSQSSSSSGSSSQLRGRHSQQQLEEFLLDLAHVRNLVPAVCRAIDRLSNPRVTAVWARKRCSLEFETLRRLADAEGEAYMELRLSRGKKGRGKGEFRRASYNNRSTRADEIHALTGRLGNLQALMAALVTRSTGRDPEFGLFAEAENCEAIERRHREVSVKRQQALALQCFAAPNAPFDVSVLEKRCNERRFFLQRHDRMEASARKKRRNMIRIAERMLGPSGVRLAASNVHSTDVDGIGDAEFTKRSFRDTSSTDVMDWNVNDDVLDADDDDSRVAGTASLLFIDRIIGLIRSRSEEERGADIAATIRYPPSSLWSLLQLYNKTDAAAEITQTVHSVILYTVIDCTIAADSTACPVKAAKAAASRLKLPGVLRDVLLGLWRLDAGYEPQKATESLSSPLVTALEADIGVAVVRSFIRHDCSSEALSFLRAVGAVLDSPHDQEMAIKALLSCGLWREALVDQRRRFLAYAKLPASNRDSLASGANALELRERLLCLVFQWFWDNEQMYILRELPLDRDEQDVLVRFLWTCHCSADKRRTNGQKEQMSSAGKLEEEKVKEDDLNALGLLIGFLLEQNRIGEAKWLHRNHLHRRPELRSEAKVAARQALLDGYCRTLPENHCEPVIPKALKGSSGRATADTIDKDSVLQQNEPMEGNLSMQSFQQTPLAATVLHEKTPLSRAKNRIVSNAPIGYSPGQLTYGQSPLVLRGHSSQTTESAETVQAGLENGNNMLRLSPLSASLPARHPDKVLTNTRQVPFGVKMSFNSAMKRSGSTRKRSVRFASDE